MKKKKILKYLIIYYGLFILIFTLGRCFARYSNQIQIIPKVSVASFNFNVSDVDVIGELRGVINLNETVVDDGYSGNSVIPGSKGIINLSLDFSEVEVGTKYDITIDKVNLPENIKFYTDLGCTNQLTCITGYSIPSTDIVEQKIYWCWEFSNDDESSYMGQEGNAIVKIDVLQNTGNNE